MGTPDGKPVLQLRRRGNTEPEPELPDLPAEGDPDHAFVDVILGRAENEAPAECGLRTIQRADFKDFGIDRGSLMPSYKDKLSTAELDDLTVFLASLERPREKK